MNEVTRPIEIITQEINFYKVQAGTAIIEIGKRLHEAKAVLPHGAWGDWLAKEVEFSERTAQNFMKIAREYGNPQLIADMGNSTTKALLLLSVPQEEREEFVSSPHEVNGEEKTVAEMTTKEMEQLMKELEAERAAKEKLQAQLELFEKEKDEVQDSAYKEAEDKIERLTAQKEEAEQDLREAEEKIAAMEAEMDELKMQAVQTTVSDESELEKIRKETEEAAQKKAEEAVQKKLEKAKKEAEKAKKEAKEAQEAIEAHEAAQKAAEEAALRAREELVQVKAETEKKLKAAGSSYITIFKVHFEAVQAEIEKMLHCIAQVKESTARRSDSSDPGVAPEEADKLKAALKALCRNIEERLEE